AYKLISHLAGRDRENVADVLRDHQVGIEGEDGVGVDLVERAAVARGERDGVLDAEAALAREVERGARHDRNVRRLRRMVAFVGAGDELIAKAEGEQGLGRAGQKRDDPQSGVDLIRSTTCSRTS